MPTSNSPFYRETTRSITIRVEPEYLEDQSDPDEGRYVWAYHVQIENNGSETVQLVSRHWKITDGRGEIHEVRGPGVVGEQPVLHPGDSFEYTSGTPLATPSGFMQGSYQMTSPGGGEFDVAIPVFSLDSPFAPSRVH